MAQIDKNFKKLLNYSNNWNFENSLEIITYYYKLFERDEKY